MTLRPFRSLLGKKAHRRSSRKSELHRDHSRKMLTQQLEDRRLLAGPELIAIRPDAGALLQAGDTLNIAPGEFNLLFKGGADLKEATINANTVRLVRSGGDGTFGDGNEQQIALGYVGLDEPGSTDPEELQRIVFRTASSASHNPTDDLTDPSAILNSFPDDTYQIEIIGAGGNVLQNRAGEAFNSGVNYALPFRLDRGAQVVAVVPQPIERTGTGNTSVLEQRSDKIVVYFDNQRLDQTDAEDPRFYRLIDTATTIERGDDITLIPKAAVYDSAKNSVTLTFDSDIPEGTYRLDVGYSADGSAANNGAVQVGSLFTSSGSVGSDFVVNGYLGDKNGSNADVSDVDTYAIRVENPTVAATNVQVNIQVDPDPAGLAIKVSLLNSSGGVVATTTGAAGATVSLAPNVSVPALPVGFGVYTVKIETVGGYGSYALSTKLTGAGLTISDDNSYADAATSLGVLGAAGITLTSAISPQGALGVTLPPYPGGTDEPGHREIQREAHIDATGTNPTAPLAINSRSYYFPANIGVDSNGIPYPNKITEEEKRIVRGIYEVLSSISGFEFVETTKSGGGGGTSIGKGDLRALDPNIGPNDGVGGLGGPGAVVLNDASFNQANRFYGDGFTETMMHEILHSLGLSHAYDVPAIMSSIALPNDVLPGDNDVVHLQRIVPPNSTDIDLFKFVLEERGKWTGETVAERLDSPSKLDSVLTLYRQNDADPNKLDLVARNDRYFGNDAFLELDLEPGTYFVGVSSTGNDNYDPKVPNSGYGGTTDGGYELKLSFQADRGDAGLRDADGTPIDGDGNGEPGGVHSFWFQASDKASTIYVDRVNDTNLSASDGVGSLADPFDTISSALNKAQNRIVVPQNAGTTILAGQKFVINDGVNPSVEFTFGTGAGQIQFAGLAPNQIATNIVAAVNAKVNAGLKATVTANVSGTRVVDFTNIDSLDVAGTAALLKAPNLIRVVGNAGADGNFDTVVDNVPYIVGSSGGPLRDGLDLLVPQGVTMMIDAGALIKMNQANIDIGSSSINISRAGSAIQVLGTPDVPVLLRSYHNDAFGGDSNGIGSPRPGDFGGIVIRDDSDLESDGIFLNYVNHADINNGGGKVFVDTIQQTFTPIHIIDARPTLSFNHISNSQNSAISASPDSFDDSLGRIGPDVHGNFLSDNKIDGLFVRINILNGSPIERLTVPGRFDDSDIAHVLTQSLIISGNPGGFETSPTGALTARAAGRLMVDPGVVVKLNNARIEAERGGSALIAEGTENRPVIFTSLFDDRYGGSGTFNTDSGAAFSSGSRGDWAGLFFGEVSFGSIDHALISFAGGDSPIEGASANFNAIEIHQADVRITNSLLKDNADGNASGTRSGRGSNQAATIYVRGSQPVIVSNSIVDNAGTAISINANSLRFENLVDSGRTTGSIDRFSQFDDNSGPLVRLNQLDNNSTNGMLVRGELLTTESIWDDTDIVHVLRSMITVQNHHTYSGLTLQSSNSESLVVKLFGNNAGFTATGAPLEIIDRIGGTIHVLGTPGHPVVLASLSDDSIGAGFAPDGTVMKNTNNSTGVTTGSSGDWRGFLFDEWSNDRNVAIIPERENPLTSGRDVNGNRDAAQFLGIMAPDEKSADENRRMGFEVNGFISPDDPNDVDMYSFQGTAGTGVWIDIDRTYTTLDAIIEVVNANGTVLARSNNTGDPTGPGSFNALTLIQNPLLGGDFYSQNTRDPGLFFRLPGSANQVGTFFVRVRSAPKGPDFATIDGQSSGKYQLQIRQRQEDEFPGSTIRFADIRDAVTAIDVRGLPAHGLLIGEAGELEGDNDTLGAAQTLVNLLETDMAAIGVEGALSSDTDVDWYRFDLTQTGVQTIPGVNDAAGTVAIVLDLDYGDKANGADTTVAVYDSAGRLIYISRESNIQDDQKLGLGLGIDDFSRGSVADKDPYIGPIHITPGRAYYVAVMSNRQLPTSLMGVFQSAMTNDLNRLTRLEPVNSVTRIVEDHIGFSGYNSQGVRIAPEEANGIFDITDKVSLDNHVKPFDLSDVVTYISTDSNGEGGDDIYTASILQTQRYVTKLRDDVGDANNDLQDIVIRSDGAMYGYRRLTTGNDTVGQLVKIDINDGTFSSTQDDNIPGNGTTPNTGDYGNQNIFNRVEQFTTSHEVDAFTFERTGTTGTSGAPIPTYDVYYAVRETDTSSKLYRARGNGDATAANPSGGTRYGYLGDIQPLGVVNATDTLTISDNATPNRNSSTIRFESKIPGVLGNGITINITNGRSGNAGATVTSVIGTTINLDIDRSPGAGAITGAPTAGAIANAINNHALASQLVTAVITSGATGTSAFNGTNGGSIVLAGGDDGANGGPILGRVTGLSYANFGSSGSLFGVTTAGELLEINDTNGRVLNSQIISDAAGVPFSFQGLALGPQNLNGGIYKNVLFAVTDSGQIVAFNSDGTVVNAFDSGDASQLISVAAGVPTTGGSFTLTFDDGGPLQTTVPISVDAPAAASVNEKQTVSTDAYGGTFTLSFEKDQAAVSSLSADIVDDLVTTISVQRLSDLPNTVAFPTASPADPFTIRVQNEEMSVTNVANGPGTGFTFTVQRGINGTTAMPHLSTATVFELVASKLDAAIAAPPVAASSALLDGGITSINATSIKVDDASVFPVGTFTIRVDHEEMSVTNVDVGTNTLTVVRGINGTTRATHESGRTISLAITGTVTVQDPGPFPVTASPIAPFEIRVGNEDMRVIGVAGNVFSVIRGINGTSAVAHADTEQVRPIETTLPIAYDASITQVQTRLRNLNVLGNNVTVTSVTGLGVSAETATVEFTNAFGSKNLVQLSADTSGLIGNEIQEITLTGPITSGDFAITFPGIFGNVTTGAIAYDASISFIQTELDTTLGAGNTIVAGGALPGQPIQIQFTGVYANTNVPAIAVTPNFGNTNEVQKLTFSETPTSGTFRLRLVDPALGISRTTANIPFDADQAAIKTALLGGGLTNANILVTRAATAGAPIFVEFQGNLSSKDVADIEVLAPDALVGSTPTVVVSTAVGGAATPAAVNEIQEVVINDVAIGGTFQLEINDTINGVAGRSNPIAYNADAVAVKAALVAGIGAFTAQNITVTGGPLSTNPIVIEFTDTLAAKNIAQFFVVAPNNLIGTDPQIAVTTDVESQQATPSTARTGKAVSVAIGTTEDGILSVRDALVGLAAFGQNDLGVGGDLQAGGTTVRFIGSYAGTNVNPLIEDNFLMINGSLADVTIAGTPGDGLPDDFTSIVTGMTGSPKGIAFSPLDFNLWHVTTQRSGDQGHGVNSAPDGSRNPGSESVTTIDVGPGADRTRSQANGGASFYFGFEQWQQNINSGTNSYLTYPGANAQMGVLNATQHQDLSSNLDIRNSYNFPGGAVGTLKSNSFSLASASELDRPTLYFNYFLETENHAGSRTNTDASDPFRDSARLFASRDGGLTWELLTTNSSILSSGNPNSAKGELPGFLSHLSDAGLNAGTPRDKDEQLVQELFDNTGVWRQARVDMSTFAGVADIQLRFDFSTAGAMNDDTLYIGEAEGLPTDRRMEDEFGEFSNANRSIRSSNNKFEGFYIDDIIVGYAERGEMVTGATTDSSITDLNQGRTNDPNATQPDILRGPYQFEIRRTGEYAGMVTGGILVGTTFDTNDRHIVVPTSVVNQDFDSETLGTSLWTPPAGGIDLFGTNIPAVVISPWTVSSVSSQSGSQSLQSGPISSIKQVSIYQATLADLGSATTSAGVIQFAVKVNSLVDVNGLRFLIDGVPQNLLATGSDENQQVVNPTFSTGDQPYRIVRFPFSSGEHTFTWIFDSTGDPTVTTPNTAFIDDLQLLQGGTGLLADQNRDRVQGMFIIDSNIIRDSRTLGINVQPGTQESGGSVPHPGSTINFPIIDPDKLVPGVVIVNNIIDGRSAIRFAGENSASPNRPVPFGRIINNTLIGNKEGGGVGIAVVDRASPTLMNNIITDFGTGILDSTPNGVSFVTRTNYFQGNNANGTTGLDPVTRPAGTPLFKDKANQNYYLEDTSAALDRSLNQLEDRPTYTSFKRELGIADSNIDAPRRDVFGQLRINSSQIPGGGGSTQFIDIGAVDRSDFDKPFAELTNPIDYTNTLREDADPNATVVHLKQPIVNNFSILLNDGQGINAPFEGTGINPTTVNSSTVTVRRNNVTLVEGVDFTIGYNEYTGELRLTPFSTLWEPAGVYEIILDNSVIADNAGNLLLNNQADGTTKFTIILPDVPLDFGDAKLAGSLNVYGTLLANNAARHAIINNASPRLGKYVDSENDSAQLTGGLDDTPASVVATSLNAPATFTIQAHPSATGGTTIQIASLPASGDILSIDIGRVAKQFELVPAGIAPGVGNIPVRFAASDTPEMIVTKLVAKINAEMNAVGESLVVQPVAGSLDTIEIFNRDDEDGVNVGIYNDGTTDYIVFLTPGVTGTTTNKSDILGFLNPLDQTGAQIPVSVTGTGFVSAWIDFDGNGVFDPVLEKVIDNVSVTGGIDPTIFTVKTPVGTTNKLTWARFRISPEGGLQPTGLAVGGEVEDYQVQIHNVPLPVPVDDPAALSTSYTINEDSTLDTTAAGIASVLDNDVISPATFSPVTVVLGQNVSNGTLVLDSATGDFTYTPHADFVGIDTFTYRLATQQSAIDTILPTTLFATVTIEVQPVNDAPLAQDKTIVALEDQPRTVLESELLANATADNSPEYPVGAPASPWDESDQVLHVVSLQVGATTIDSTTPISAFPVLTTRGQILSATFDTTDPANIFLVSFQYQSNLDVNRDNLRSPLALPILDEITYTISDDGKSDDPNVLGDGGADDEIGVFDAANGRLTHTATISFDVRPQNDAPIANDDLISKTSARWISYWANINPLVPAPVPTEDQSLTIPIDFLLANDVNARPAAADELFNLNDAAPVIPDPGTVLTTALGGTVTFNNDGTFTYRAPDNYYGEDTFTYTVQDAGINEDASGNRPVGALTDTAVVTIFVEPINDKPVAVARELRLDEIVEYDAFGNLVNTNRRVSFDKEFLLQQLGTNPVLPGVADPSLIAPYNESNQALRVVAFTDADELIDAETDTELALNGGTGTLMMTTPSGGILSFNFSAYAFVDGYYEPAVDYNGLAPHEASPLNPLEFFNYIVSDDGTVMLPPVPPGTAYTPNPFVEARSLPARVSLTVADKNDAPEFPAFVTVTFPEDIQTDGSAVYYDIYAGSRIGNYDPLVVRPDRIFPGHSTALDERLTETLSFSYVTTFEPAGMFSATPVLDKFGVLTLKPNPDAFGYAVFEITATDNGKSFNATTGLYEDDFRSTTRTLTINITPVNDQPVTEDRTLTISEVVDNDNLTGLPNGNQAVLPILPEDLLRQATVNDPAIITQNPSRESDFANGSQSIYDEYEQNLRVVVFGIPDGSGGFTLVTAADSGTVFPTINGGTLVFNFDGTGAFSGGEYRPAVDYNRLPPFNPTESFTYIVEDVGATTIPGADQVTPVAPSPIDYTAIPDPFGNVNNRSVAKTVRITVTEVNDPPFIPNFDTGVTTVDGTTITYNPNSISFNERERTNSPSMTFDLYQIAGVEIKTGPLTALDELASQSLTSIIVQPALDGAGNSRVPAGMMAANPILRADGRITISPTADAFGVAVFDVIVTDNGSNVAPNNNVSIRKLTITINPVNDAPLAADQMLDLVTEAVERDSNGNLISPLPVASITFDKAQLLRNAVAGVFATTLNPSFNESEQELRVVAFRIPGLPAELAVVDGSNEPGLSGGNGTVTRTTLNDATLTFTFVNGEFTSGTYTPSIDYNRRSPFNANDQFEFMIEDRGSVTIPGSSPVATQNIGSLRSVYANATITTIEKNDPPEFNFLPVVNILERDDNGETIVPGWASNILAGPTTALDELERESVQFNFVSALSNVPAGLFRLPPQVANNGVLSIFPSPDAVGTATIVIEARDFDPSTPGFVSASHFVTFTLNVQPVNDAPRLNPLVINTAGTSPDPDLSYSVALDGTLTYTLREDNTQPGGIASTGFFIPLVRGAVPPPNGYAVPGLLDVFNVGPDNEGTTAPGGSQVLQLASFPRTTQRGGTLTEVFENGQRIGLNYVPLMNYNSAIGLDDGFTYGVNDNSIINGDPTAGESYSLTQGTLFEDQRTVVNRVRLRMSPVNDRPEFETSSLSVESAEDAELTTKNAFAFNITGGPRTSATDESAQTLTFDVQPIGFDANEFFTTVPTISSTGRLTYQSAPDVFGSFEFTVMLRDNGPTDTATRGDLFESVPVTMTINVRPVNDAPVKITNAPDLIYSVGEDGSVVIPFVGDAANNPGLLDFFRVGPANETSTLVGGGQTINVASPYPATSDGGGTITPVLNEFDEVIGLRYTPTLNFAGTDKFTYTISDNGVTVALGSGGIPTNDFKSITNQVTIGVIADNDPPQFNGAGDVDSIEDQGAVVVPNWATDVQAGPDDAIDELQGDVNNPPQTVSFAVNQISGLPSLFAVSPTVTITGNTASLSYTTAADANGDATFEVTLKDNGSPNQSVTKTFTIRVAPVNDVPTFTAGAVVDVDEDSDAYSEVWATNISQGPADETGPPVRFEVTVPTESLGLFEILPTVDSDGVLQFKPAKDASGSASLEVTAFDSLDAASLVATLQINIGEVNDPPIAVADEFDTDEDAVVLIESSDLTDNDLDPDLASNPSEKLTVVLPAISTTQRGAVLTYDVLTGQITYDPTLSVELQRMKPGDVLIDTFSYSVKDADGVESDPVEVKVTVTGVNDAPILQPDTVVINPDGQTRFRPQDNDTDIDGDIVPTSIIITSQPKFGALSVEDDGTLVYTPFASFDGLDEFRYTVADNLGQQSKQATVTITPNKLPIVPNFDDVVATSKDTTIVDVGAVAVAVEGQLDLTSINIIAGPSNGTATANPDGTISYKANAGYLGSDSLQFTITDSSGRISKPATISFNVVAFRLQNPNPARFSDVNASGSVTTLDALLIINRIGLAPNNTSSIPVTAADRGPLYYDVNGDDIISALDALQVINQLMLQSPQTVSQPSSEQPSSEQIPQLSPLAESAVSQSTTFDVSQPIEQIARPTKVVDTSLPSSEPKDDLDLIAESHKTAGAEENDSRLSSLDEAFADLL